MLLQDDQDPNQNPSNGSHPVDPKQGLRKARYRTLERDYRFC